ncbi:MAG TPA: hypothetical protein PKH07_17895, partial [bacterium]|nr:hypothetical protein [bacterium]
SRCYLFENNRLVSMTCDDTLAGHGLTRVAGTKRLFFQRKDIELSRHQLLLLTSDGIHGYMTDQEIGAICRKHSKQPADVVRSLIQASLQAGGMDNATAVAILINK